MSQNNDDAAGAAADSAADQLERKEGYIRMKKKKALSKWRKRYCILDGPLFFYYDVYVPGDGDDNVYRGKIYLESERTEVIGDDTQFSLKTLSGDVYIFQPGNNPDCLNWMKSINQHMVPRAVLDEKYHGYEMDSTKEQRKLNKIKSRDLIKSRRNQYDSIQSFDVTVPEGYSPGDKLKVLYKQQQISVVIPTGVYPGETFEVRLQKRPQAFKETIQHAGWLSKHAQNGKGLPKKRWFVLTKSHLHYADAEGLQPKMKWDLKDARVIKKGGTTIRLEMTSGILDLGCGSSDNVGAWMGRLQLCINQSSNASTKQVLSDGTALVGEQLHGRPVFAGWLKKHATTGKGLAKQKWFVMTPTHLAYMDWEGAHVKNAWPLKGATVRRVDQMLEYQVVFENKLLPEPLTLVLTCETLEDMENWFEKLDEYIKKNNNLDAKTLLKEEKESVKRKMTLAKKHLRAQQAPQGSGVMRLPHNHNGSTFPLTLRMDSGDAIRVDMEVPSGAAPGQSLEFTIRCAITDADFQPPPPAASAGTKTAGAKIEDSPEKFSPPKVNTQMPSYLAGGSSAPGSAERKSRRNQRKQRRDKRKTKEPQTTQEETPPPTPTKATAKAMLSPTIEAQEEEADDNDLHTWMNKRGFQEHTEALMSIGVETADDLSLVTYEDLTDLKIDDSTAKQISIEIAKLES